MTINKENWFWKSVFDNKKIYNQIILASVFINFFAIASAFYIMTVYDKVVPNSAYSSLIALTIGMVIVHIFDFIMKMLRSYFTDIAGQKLDDVVAGKLYDKISSHDSSVLGKSNSNIITSIREFETFRDFFTSSSLVVFIDIPFMILFIIVLWFIGGLVALVPTLIAPFVILVIFLIQPNLKKLSEKELGNKQNKLGILTELLNNHETVKTITGGKFLRGRWVGAVSDQNKNSVISKVFANFSTTFAQSGIAASQTFIVFFGIYLIASTDLTMGALVACVILSGRTLSPLAQLSGILNKLSSATVAFKKIDILMEQEAREDTVSTEAATILDAGKIEIKNLNYSKDDRKILDNITVTINPGESVGIIGPVGGGKSSLLKAIVGYYGLTHGSLKIDSYDINNIPGKKLREQIAYLPQSTQLFHDTIQANIVAGLDDISDNRIVEASKKANAHNFISSLPGGYGAKLYENGKNLSGGQRQKIALARTFLREPSIIILDEPTNSLDGETENIMTNYIKESYAKKTMILATHKPSLLHLVDRVLIVVDGKIVADGPRDKILEQFSGNQGSN
jgi:ATP-binding cassette subfamily C protein LapB